MVSLRPERPTHNTNKQHLHNSNASILNKGIFQIFKHTLSEYSCRYESQEDLNPSNFSAPDRKQRTLRTVRTITFCHSGLFASQAPSGVHLLHKEWFGIIFSTSPPPAHKKNWKECFWMYVGKVLWKKKNPCCTSGIPLLLFFLSNFEIFLHSLFWKYERSIKRW